MDMTIHALVEALPGLLRALTAHGFDPSVPGLLLGTLVGWTITSSMRQRRVRKQEVDRRTRRG